MAIRACNVKHRCDVCSVHLYRYFDCMYHQVQYCIGWKVCHLSRVNFFSPDVSIGVCDSIATSGKEWCICTYMDWMIGGNDRVGHFTLAGSISPRLSCCKSASTSSMLAFIFTISPVICSHESHDIGTTEDIHKHAFDQPTKQASMVAHIRYNTRHLLSRVKDARRS